MKKTRDKVLDIIYKMMDILIVIAILIIIVFILSSKLNPMFKNKQNDKAKVAENNDAKVSDNKVINDTEDLPPSALENDNQDDLPEVSSENGTATEPEPEKPAEKAKTITVPDVATSHEIGEIVAKAGYCKDANEFTKKAIELKLDTRLIPGTYEIPENATLEDIVKIIARKK